MSRDISPENVRLVVGVVLGEEMAMAVEDVTSATSATVLVTSPENARKIRHPVFRRTAATAAMV